MPASPNGWLRCRDMVAARSRIVIGHSDVDIEDAAQAFATDLRPVIRMYSEKSVMGLYSKYGIQTVLRTANVVSSTYDDLIAARTGKPCPRKWADNMLRASVWKAIAIRIHDEPLDADLELIKHYTTQYTVLKET